VLPAFVLDAEVQQCHDELIDLVVLMCHYCKKACACIGSFTGSINARA
jgi:hypothetical protein